MMRPRVARSWIDRKALKNNLQQQLQEVEQRKHDLIPEHQKMK